MKMLSMPEFTNFFSSSDVVIDLNDSSSTSIGPSLNSHKSLSNEGFEPEKLVNHIYETESDSFIQDCSSEETVQRFYENDSAYVTLNDTYTTNSGKIIPKQDKDQDSLAKIFSESKLISSDIAIQNKQQKGIDYNKVLQEFGKMIQKVSSKTKFKGKF